jgi:phage-related protein
MQAEDTPTTKQMCEELKAEIRASARGIIRQMYVAMLGQMVVLLGFAYFFATYQR